MPDGFTSSAWGSLFLSPSAENKQERRVTRALLRAMGSADGERSGKGSEVYTGKASRNCSGCLSCCTNDCAVSYTHLTLPTSSTV